MADQGVNIAVPRSIFSRSRYGGANQVRKRAPILDMLLEKDGATDSFFSFKREPGKDCSPETSETRPRPTSCQHCLPESQIGTAEEIKYLGLASNFLPPTMSPYNSRLVQMFPFYYHYQRSCNFTHLYKLPTQKQLEEDENLLSLYPEEMFDNASLLPITRNSVLEAIRQMEVKTVWRVFLSSFLRLSAWISQKFFSMCFESVLVHGAQIEVLRHIQSTTLPIIYVPTYRSNYDKALILWTLAHHGLRTPLFISNHGGGGRFSKYFGGIGSSFKVVADDKYSELKYSSALSAYVRNVIRNKNYFMFNVESRRSRNGHPSPAVYGTEIFKIIYDEFLSGTIEDAYFVPVSVSYESLPDAQELFSLNKFTSKSTKTWWGAVYSILSFIKDRLSSPVRGNVIINFSQPMCLREFDRMIKRNPKIQRIMAAQHESYSRSRDCAYLRWDSLESVNSVSSIYGELTPLYPDDDDLQAAIIDCLNFHVIFDAGKSESFMPTHLVAFLLMKKFRQGVSVDKLGIELEWLINLIKSLKRDFGFAIIDCDTESIIARAIKLLPEDIDCQVSIADGTFKILPKANLESLRRLDYYANYILPEFMMASIIATAVFTLCGPQLTVLQGFKVELQFRDDDFMHHCNRIYEVFAEGFLLHPPCLTREAAIRKQISDMGDKGMLTFIQRDTRSYYWEDHSEDDSDDAGGGAQHDIATEQDFVFIPEFVKVPTTKSTFEKLNFYRNLLVPYLDIYASLANGLKILLNDDGSPKQIQMVEMRMSLLAKLEEESDKHFSYCRELLNVETIKSFLMSCENHSIIYARMEPQTFARFYRLEEKYASEESLDNLASDILYYVTK